MPRVKSPLRKVVPLALGTALIAALGFGPAAIAAPDDSANESTPTTTINGYRSVGYYGQWMASDPERTLRALFLKGAHSRTLTHLNYSFGNVAGDKETLDKARAAGVKGLDDVQPYTCFISDGIAPSSEETGAAGEAQADFVRAYSADESVLGIADAPGQKLAGAFNQLAQLKRVNPDLKALVSLGGWSWSASFSHAVASDESRAALAASCIDLYIDGNLPEIDGRGGKGAAAGLFDGFDLDWEWPAAPDWSQAAGNAIDPENDRANFLAFVKELRAQLDARAAETGRSYEISAFLPASPAVITAGGWNDPALWEQLDFGNIQGYDLWGSWSTQTGHQGNIYGDDAHNWGLGLDSIVASYTSAGISPSQLNLGLAGYGQGWRDAERGAWQESGGAVLGGTRTWDELKALGLEIEHEYTSDGKFNASFGYNPNSREWYSFDDPFAVSEKAQWAISQGLGGVDYWQIAGDTEGELSVAGAQVLSQAARGPVAGTEKLSCDAVSIWNGSTVYSGGDRVALDGKVYEALWYAKATQPGKESYGPWQTIRSCGDAENAVHPWYKDHVYNSGDEVAHGGQRYVARWWTRAEEPGTAGTAWIKK